MLYLASQSPRRRALLAQFGLPFGVIDVDVVECRDPGEGPDEYVRRVARDKAGAGLRTLAAEPGAVVLGADTEVVLNGDVFGKPRDDAEAASMLRKLSGRTHQVISSVALVGADRQAQTMVITDVTFAPLDEATIAAYVATGEPRGKAGGYAIQGGAALFVAHLSGSYSGVVGLPLQQTGALLRDFGLAPRPFVADAQEA
ncbi:Maf family nucleotide pyrophosphatase [Luteimonas sp. S4-F44]|uniref:Maf family protein n=1 Tax=Luteimonas sp. S4-F44 TaxID=2925842 RepID=UPI001F52C806|nr:Maf family protein [Luteimonas sp. S4-F44]UNK41526.1 Maf family nucleotide pyrophosphatase [Luteimonas sp. S4-F44]